MQAMTSEEFIVELSKTERGWYLSTGGDIRRGVFIPTVPTACPITDVCEQVTGEIYSISYPKHAAISLGLGEDLASQIIAAADNKAGCDQELRQKLLRATGLKEMSCDP